jgi:hypothetical protein
VAQNATDPENDPLGYRFEIDTRPELDSPERQVSPELAAGIGETAWTPLMPLVENQRYHWRVHASDGSTSTASVLATFLVDAQNEAPGKPVALDPVDGRSVSTETPTLRLRNTFDPDGDALVYELVVRDASGQVVASVAGVAAGAVETTWTVEPALAEDQAFTWSARASDGELSGPWSDPAGFRVDAIAEPPSAPTPLLPGNGSEVGERRPGLVVTNAASPAGLPLAYTFVLEAVAQNGAATLVERAEGIAEGAGTTSWTPSADLPNGEYQWQARASDGQDGPWSSTWRFTVLVDPPPAAPTGLQAMAGNASVSLVWDASPELDVTGYRVRRSTTAGGPYTLVAAVTTPAHLDTGLTNGVTYYYVVTARDARADSPPSNEAAARPEAPQSLAAEIRYDPGSIPAECLLPGGDGGNDGGGPCGSACPEWLSATIELPAGHDPSTIDVASLLLFGSVRADPGYQAIVDVDHDGRLELRVRFRFDAVQPHLTVGANAATIVGRAGAVDFSGSGTIHVLAIETDLRMTPRTVQRRSSGQTVQGRITFAEGVDARQVAISSVRLNGVVAVERVVDVDDEVLVLKFDRAAVIAVLPLGSSVEVRVSGTLAGLPFVAVDHIRVIE